MTENRVVFRRTKKDEGQSENFQNTPAKINNEDSEAKMNENEKLPEKRKPGRPPAQKTIEALSEVKVELPEQTMARFRKLIDESRLVPIEELAANTGRPMKYKPIFCGKIIEEMAQGKSKETVATELGITYQTFYNWAKRYSDFHYAVKVGEQLCKRWWLEQGRLNLCNKQFNHVLWMMNMTNMHDWASSNNKINGKIEVNETKKVKVEYNSSESAQILEVLNKCGAIKMDKMRAIDAEVVESDDD
jgi:hypothetical protein